jgi:hypothetical protein
LQRNLARYVEVCGTRYAIQQMEIVGQHAGFKQRLAQVSECAGMVVDTCEQYGLIQNRRTGFRSNRDMLGG